MATLAHIDAYNIVGRIVLQRVSTTENFPIFNIKIYNQIVLDLVFLVLVEHCSNGTIYTQIVLIDADRSLNYIAHSSGVGVAVNLRLKLSLKRHGD
jgi:hypothetical protein